MFVVCFTYSVIVPFIMVIGTFYFAVAFCVYKHQLLYVYCPRYETGGSLFPTLYGYTLTGINFSVITMLGYLGIKSGWKQFLVLVPLVPVVEVFRYFTAVAYGPSTQALSTDRAMAVDEKKRFRKLLTVGDDPSREERVTPIAAPGVESEIDRPAYHQSFNAHLYRQPALDEQVLAPVPNKWWARKQRRHRCQPGGRRGGGDSSDESDGRGIEGGDSGGDLEGADEHNKDKQEVPLGASDGVFVSGSSSSKNRRSFSIGSSFDKGGNVGAASTDDGSRVGSSGDAVSGSPASIKSPLLAAAEPEITILHPQYGGIMPGGNDASTSTSPDT